MWSPIFIIESYPTPTTHQKFVLGLVGTCTQWMISASIRGMHSSTDEQSKRREQSFREYEYLLKI